VTEWLKVGSSIYGLLFCVRLVVSQNAGSNPALSSQFTHNEKMLFFISKIG